MEDEDDYSYLDFVPKPLTTPFIKPGGGLTIKTPINSLQLIFAKINYESYKQDLHSFQKISLGCSVALFTRTADTHLVSHYAEKIRDIIKSKNLLFSKYNNCDKCLSISTDHNRVREAFFTELKEKREFANEILHMLDKIEKPLKYPVKEVFDYCYTLYQNKNLIYSENIVLDLNLLPILKCKNCKAA